MKKLVMLINLLFVGTISMAQYTAYVSKDRITILSFASPVNVLGKIPKDLQIIQKENALITLKANQNIPQPYLLKIRDVNTSQVFRIPVAYSYGRSGQRIEIGNKLSAAIPTARGYAAIARDLSSGKRNNIADHQKTGGVKAWVGKISLASNKLFFRVDVRNKSKLPYELDFARFYIRDLKTVERMATHEEEIIPTYTSLSRKTVVGHKQEIARVFAFKRFSLSENQALNIELYEHNGNRHIYLQVKQDDLSDLTILQPRPQQSLNNLVAATHFN
ncbi:DUF4138 domain-containing protein [Mucilaginibacter ginkgonis]|uniref:DUF4138 domain-containing protein n=1 Tax=Mucilaginibacter ginkgonis TaxID=2682091 RepID=A0A6I4HZG6_9SPHI|nr:DUF4138 domain-containing protein [Mucilaginibacter ginkgonis]QQL50152.1 DUF4138 domain-containing protein [Mucilaginibacter ginkgonis]